MSQTKTIFDIPASRVGSLKGYEIGGMEDVNALGTLGISFHPQAIRDLQREFGNGLAMDSAVVGNLTTASISTPIQFLQAWLPGFVEIVTQARKIDEIIGVTTIGQWHDEEIVQGVSERSGNARLYSDLANMPQSNWNVNFNRATVVRFEHGMMVTRLSEARAGAMNYNDAEAKRKACAIALEIVRNQIGFYGFNNGLGRTYGILNAPGLPAYVDMPNGASGSASWTTKTTLEIIDDILMPASTLRTQSGDLVDVKRTPITLVLPTNRIDLLSKPTEFGYSIQKWMSDNYPNIRVVSCPEFQAANGGENVMYMFADSYGEDSTDDGRTFIQMVQTKFITLGVEQIVKGYKEDYANATAGVMCKRPFLVFRGSGI